ncbi:hypothetical protein AB0L14_21755 [Streptomyces sp. NPDC052727]|uniref:hypothetical protein n=1 Tax=Streptomyces sp. NPDC052727 TaxID=3154854 RepID=UPI003428A14D
MWIQQYFVDDGQVRRRDLKDRPPGAERLVTPYDTAARGSMKRAVIWDGYKVHLTETCEPDSSNLITHVATTDSIIQDVRLVAPIHAYLADRHLLPGRHLVDAGYATARGGGHRTPGPQGRSGGHQPSACGDAGITAWPRSGYSTSSPPSR